MIVSWDWLKQYVTLDMTPAELAERLMMAGLNHEETYAVGDDVAINLEVTSNRPDCLGHLGIAREAAVLFDRPLEVPAAKPKAGTTELGELAKLRVENPRECPRYTARVLRGVKVGPSPAWLVRRLTTLGVATINNVVDVTNYVMLECGQPLHAFDLAKLKGRQIIVRQATKGENFLAINHKAYALEPTTCVIADAERVVGLAGVMGGADTEVSAATSELLIESAAFDPMSIRNTARALNLHSDSSYRFERGLDPEGVDWASRRACELILELAGGELAAGVLDAGEKPQPRAPITLRFAQLKRVLGIDVPPVEAREILAALGNQEQQADEAKVTVVPPSWRRDLAREIDLIEEVARVYGYDKIPEDVSVPMATSHRTEADRVLAKTRQVLTAAGFDEAMTTSAVEGPWSTAFSPWTDAPALRANTPVLRRADQLRRSIV
ncbi:MAG: phenylalanine--tRNA ligase subunit beta, partial [Pirellulales bacterium]